MARTPDNDSQSSVPDTEATVRPIINEDDDDTVNFGDVGNFGVVLRGWSATSGGVHPARGAPALTTNADETLMYFKQPRISEIGTFALPTGEAYYRNINTCAGRVPTRRKEAARLALKDYGGEPDDFPGLSRRESDLESQASSRNP
ncbi:hypothetical protein QQS21_008970 [Conoideocrella luteorostrata]|uniref:Uncharacterized protein n=1 Tax=Conoideocrella luteorostrata TaxID=1105319 RepID=A0AAJ0CIP8_9HYPO|nr:hypothetical protein QQS21_008970 [Conoideocrella luteorostrata]